MIVSHQSILFVEDQGRSRDFYQVVLGREASLDVPGMTEFQLTPHSKLGLMPRAGASRLLGEEEISPGGIGGELYLYVPDPQAWVDRALAAGGRLVSALQPRNWGDRAAYLKDPDGHLLAFASAT